MTELGAAWDRHPDLAAVPPAQARQIAEEVRRPWREGGPRMAAVTERALDGIRLRLYDPGGNGPKPALIYLHGGGWTLFSLDTHDRLMREYAARADVIVAGIDYALAPEAKYPVALGQVVSVTKQIGERAAAFDIDGERIAIGGDSAGANLALAAALRLRDEGEEQLLRAMVLNYGVFARSSSEEARVQFGGRGNMLSSDEMEGFWRNYLRHEDDALDPLVCPSRADLSRLPPALLVVPECDLLAEQSVDIARRMRESGVAVELKIYRGAVHSFLEAVSIAPLAAQAFAESAEWLRKTLA